jgi:hypothetical protein
MFIGKLYTALLIIQADSQDSARGLGLQRSHGGPLGNLNARAQTITLRGKFKFGPALWPYGYTPVTAIGITIHDFYRNKENNVHRSSAAPNTRIAADGRAETTTVLVDESYSTSLSTPTLPLVTPVDLPQYPPGSSSTISPGFIGSFVSVLRQVEATNQ